VKKMKTAAARHRAPWGVRVRAALAGLMPRFAGRDLAGALAGGSSRDDLPVRLSNRTYAGTRNVAVRELGFDQPLLWVVVALLAWGLVMVYSASIALPDNPRFRTTPTRTSCCGTAFRWSSA
jgi:cell division protein FtsW